MHETAQNVVPDCGVVQHGLLLVGGIYAAYASSRGDLRAVKAGVIQSLNPRLMPGV